jgi:hypothetical protein
MYSVKSKLVVAFIFFAATIGLNAQEPEKKDRENDPSQAVNASKLAIELANYGYEHQSPLSLVESARIISENPFSPLLPAKSEASTGETGEKTKKTPEITVERLLADAKSFAKSDETILALIGQTEKEIQRQQSEQVSTKGRRDGPAAVTRRVHGNSSYTDYITFSGQSLAEVAIIGDGDTDLDLYVYDENGNLIDSDMDYTDDCYVSFRPKWTGTFKVVVKNRGSIYNDYMLMVN